VLLTHGLSPDELRSNIERKVHNIRATCRSVAGLQAASWGCWVGICSANAGMFGSRSKGPRRHQAARNYRCNTTCSVETLGQNKTSVRGAGR
jgi:hypothetical protein